MEVGAGVLSMEQLFTNFLTGALGLSPGAALCEVNARQTPTRAVPSLHSDPPVMAAWKAQGARITICGAYDEVQSHRLKMHVVYLEWWTAAGVHHEGWWRCDPKHPQEWTRGYGEALMAFSATPVEGERVSCAGPKPMT